MNLEQQNAVTPDLVQQAPDNQSDVNQKIQEFLKRHDFQIQKHNVRDWGSFDVIFSTDGEHWYVGKTFGWGFTPEYAAADTIREIIQAGPDEQFIAFMHPERIEELKQLVNNDQPVQEN
jgi:hypothetical protein